MLRKSVTQERRDALKLIVKRFVVIAFVCELLLAAVGDAALRSLSQSEPRKFAAIEAVTTTGGHSPYILGGKVNPDTEEVEGAIKIDSVLSMMTGFTPDKSITGLDAYPHSDWPLLIVHTLFEMKMTLVGFVTLVPLLYLLFQFRWKQFGENRWLQRALIACAPVSILIIELGWIVTELGRQPYAVSGYLTTADAFSKNPSVLQWGIIFPITFVVLLILSSLAVKKILHSRPV
jgi:cytochrome d ubiquinol oxidase subunit I